MKSACLAGAAYTAIVFSIGFVLGTVRVLLFAPVMGKTMAVLFEGPFILTASWFASCVLIRHFHIRRRLGDRVCMGAIAFALLMVAELLLALLFFGRTIGEHIASYGELAHCIGLAGQTLFGAFPVMQLACEASRRKTYPAKE